MRYRPREEEPKTKKLVVNVTPDDHQFLKVLAADQGETMSQFIIRAIRHYLKEVMKEDREIGAKYNRDISNQHREDL